MKSYKDVVRNLAEKVFSAYMGGAMNEWASVVESFDTVAFIFGFTYKRVEKDVDREYVKIKKAYYSNKF